MTLESQKVIGDVGTSTHAECCVATVNTNIDLTIDLLLRTRTRRLGSVLHHNNDECERPIDLVFVCVSSSANQKHNGLKGRSL